jgi:N-acetylmuramoyl-L-alanine amidase
MHRSRTLPGIAFALAALAGMIGQAATALAREVKPTTVERIRYIGTHEYSRVLVDLSGPSAYHMEAVSPTGAGGPPDRLVIDFTGAKLGPEARPPLEVGDDVLRRIRTGQYTADTARIVLDLARNVEARVLVLSDPHRLIVDLKGKAPSELTSLAPTKPDAAAPPPDGAEAAARSLAAVAPAPAAPAAVPPAPLAPAPAAVPPAPPAPLAVAPPAHVGRVPRRIEPAPDAAPPLRVVIDPGHGGKDPGARGRGLVEKDVVLNVSKLLASRLRQDGIEVFLTRRDDRFLSLEQRTAIANSQDADLFISVHANASSNTALRGVEVYYLNNTDNRGTLRLAAMENNLHWDPHDPKLAGEIPDLSYILSDLRQTYKVEESKQLAEQLQGAVVNRLGSEWDSIEDLGVKEGPFYVLVGAYMPCVLVEVSFLTNSIEGRRLASAKYQRALADGMYEGVRRYLSQAKLAKTL